ncbi:WhiB family transcriptional regulator [Streptomyces cinnamoneus]|uniref:WhiB family transcriptional regulator n=1 Tax=Streptomyces cinnamoneus TaxID=53446 RepID=UPI0033E74050
MYRQITGARNAVDGCRHPVNGELGFDLAPAPGLREALCKVIEPEIFYPEPGEDAMADMARELCGRCPVRSACLEAALTAEGSAVADKRFGIRGGEGPKERYLTYRRRRRAALGDEATRTCGKAAGYYRHRRDGEDPCPACLDAYRQRRSSGRTGKAVAA